MVLNLVSVGRKATAGRREGWEGGKAGRREGGMQEGRRRKQKPKIAPKPKI